MTGFDWILAAVVVASALLAMMRGLISETLGIGALVAAGIGTLFGLPYVVDLAQPFLGDGLLAAVASGVVTFIALYVIFSFLAGRISDAVPEEGGVGAFDRVGGLLFGAARGVAILAVLYAGLDAIMTRDEQPEWITEARFYPVLTRGSETVRLFARDALNAASKTDAGYSDEAREDLNELMSDESEDDDPPPPLRQGGRNHAR